MDDGAEDGAEKERDPLIPLQQCQPRQLAQTSFDSGARTSSLRMIDFEMDQLILFSSDISIHSPLLSSHSFFISQLTSLLRLHIILHPASE